MEQFIPLMILIGLIVLFKLGVLPYVSYGGRSSTNNIVKANVQSDDRLRETGNDKQGVLNQERTDWMLRWLVSGTVFLWIPLVTDWYWWAIATVLGTMWTEVFDKFCDAFGHTVEIITVDDPDYEKAEIERMKRSSPAFREMSITQITEYVNKLKPRARLWKRIML